MRFSRNPLSHSNANFCAGLLSRMYLEFYACTYFLCHHQYPLPQVPGLSHKELSFPCFILTDTPLILSLLCEPPSPIFAPFGITIWLFTNNSPAVSVVRQLKYYTALRLLAPHQQAFRVYLIACLTAITDDTRSPWVTQLPSVPCRPQTPWCDG